MDRTAWIVIILCVVGLFAWQWYYQQEYSEANRQQAQQTQQAGAQATAAAPAQEDAAAGSQVATEAADTAPATVDALPAPVQPQEPPVNQVEAVNETVELGELQLEFTNLGGGIASVQLLNHDAKDGNFVTLNRFGDVPIGAVGMRPGEFEGVGYDMQYHRQSGEVSFTHTGSDGLQIEKTYQFPSKDAIEAAAHTINFTVKFSNTGQAPLARENFFINLGSIAPVHEQDWEMYTGFDYFSQGKDRFIDVNWFTPSRIPLIGIQLRGARPEFSESAPGLAWAAVKNQYFSTILSIDQLDGNAVWARRFEVTLSEGGNTKPAIRGALQLPGFELQPGEVVIREFSIYTGPNRYNWLKQLGADQEAVLRYGFFKPISLGLLSGLEFLHGLLAGSYALAIIALTVCIKAVLWPLQNKATKSMRRMAALSPKMTELREKYKDDPTRMNQELMKLYKTYGVNPFGGCLPMLIQIPIFFGFYSMLRSSVELRNSSFLWVDDLSQPDTIFSLFGLIPVNPLPLIMAASMFWQMHITPKTGDSVQQRIFLFMPLIFLIFCYNFASALALYWTVSNMISIFQIYMTRDQPIPALTKVEQPEPAMPMGTGKKKKKPRGPKK